MAYRRSGVDAFPHPRPPSGHASRHLASTNTHRVRRPASPASYTRRPLPPGPGPLDKKGEKLILRPINGAATSSETFKPRKPSERSSNVKPLRALHSLDQQYTGRPESESSTFNNELSSLHTRRTKSFDDINFTDPKKRVGDSAKKLQPLSYRSSNFGHLSENLARGGSPHHSTLLSPSPHLKVETTYVSSYTSPSTSPRLSPHSPNSLSSTTKTRRESFGGTTTLRRTPSVLANKRSTSLGESPRSFSTSRSSLVSVHTSDFSSAVKPGEKGLENLGNTCYQNTIYQCLSHTVKLREFLVLYRCSDTNPNSLAGGDMIKEFGKLVRDMWDNGNKKRVLKPSGLRRVVSRNLTFFANYRQHDAQEFLRAFVDGLHDDVNKIHVKPRYDTDISDHLSDENKFMESWRRQTSREKSILSDLFVGVQKSTLNCMDCGNQRCTFDAFWDLSLPIPVHSSDHHDRRIHLEDCLKLYCAKEVLEGDNKVTCNHCRKRTRQQKWLQIERFPQVLVLHLKRFVEASNTYIKVDNIHKNLSTVQFPLTRLSLECTTDKEIPPTYDCYAVANHCGNRGGGHYTAFCRHSTQNKWIMYSDERVSSISSLTSVVSANAYILFYERTNPTSHL